MWYDRTPRERRRTLLELLHKVSHNLLEFRAVHGELILKILDGLQQILRQFVPRAWMGIDTISMRMKLHEAE